MSRKLLTNHKKTIIVNITTDYNKVRVKERGKIMTRTYLKKPSVEERQQKVQEELQARIIERHGIVAIAVEVTKHCYECSFWLKGMHKCKFNLIPINLTGNVCVYKTLVKNIDEKRLQNGW